MLRKILLTALAAGLAAGLFVSMAQRLGVIPLIQQAEIYEQAAESAKPADHGGHDHAAAAEWEPEEGFQRIGLTIMANVLTGIGAALVLVAGFVLSGREIGWRTGLLWGLAGFAAFTLAPSLGLPPALPGAAEADLAARQIWWIATAASTAVGIALLAFLPKLWSRILAVALIVLPHAVGAPKAEGLGLAPPELAMTFVIASIVTAFLFWIALGLVAGLVYKKVAK